MSVRVRIEPSPSGSIHVGNAMTASFNWYFARKQGGVFILRIADTDRSRVTPEGIRSALEDLRWLGLQWDEGPEVGGPHAPYFQSERIDLYRDAVARLREGGHAYPCYCTPDELDARRKQAAAEGRPPGYDGRCRRLTDAQRSAFEAEGRKSATRFAMPEGETVVADVIRGETTFAHAHIEDFVIARADGTPLYMLAAAYDDMVMEMTHVIRGEEHVANTPKQIQIMRALGRKPPLYAHIPLLVAADRTKLSKRHGATSVAEYRRDGIVPEVLLNYLAILNWSIGDGVTERFTVDELVEHFSLEGVTRTPSAFDRQKLEAMNGDRIRELSPEELTERIVPFLVREEVVHEPVPEEELELLRRIVPLIQERMKRLDEAPGQVRFFFYEPPLDERARALLTSSAVPILQGALEVLETVEPWETATIQEALQAWADAAALKRKEAFQPVRAALTGSLVSPPLFESIEILGREVVIARLRDRLGELRNA